MSAFARVVIDILVRDPFLKVLALLLAAILFVLTRDEVTRSFEIPIRIVADPDRVLLTELPGTMQVRVVGPWTRVNRLQEYDFGTATLDLRGSEPGPLQIDRASIVMPAGVVLADVQYDHVDLRFDAVVTRDVQIDPALLGSPHPDYRVVRVESVPTSWGIRGGRSLLQGISSLSTEPLEIGGAEGTQKARLALVEPPGAVSLVPGPKGAASVSVRVVIEPLLETRELTVPVAVPDDLDRLGVIPDSYAVEVSGPLPRFRDLDALDTAFPVEATVVPQEGRTADGGRAVEVRFGWKSTVTEDIRAALSIDHGVERINLPPPPEPPAVPPV